MANINFTCPHCSFQKQLPASAEGQQGNCPSCNAVVTITAGALANPQVSPQQQYPPQQQPFQQPLQQPLPQQSLPDALPFQPSIPAPESLEPLNALQSFGELSPQQPVSPSVVQQKPKKSGASSHWPLTIGIASTTLVLGLILGSVVGYALNGSSNKDVVANNSSTNSGISVPGGNNASSGKVDTPPATEEKSRGRDPLTEFDALLLDNSQNKKFDTDGRGAMVVKNTVTYDVAKADSLVAPYSATITFGVIYDQSMIDLRSSDPEKARAAEATGKMPLSFSKYYRGFFEYKDGEWIFTGGYSKPHIPDFPWNKVGGKPEVGEYMENIIGQVITIPNR